MKPSRRTAAIEFTLVLHLCACGRRVRCDACYKRRPCIGYKDDDVWTVATKLPMHLAGYARLCAGCFLLGLHGDPRDPKIQRRMERAATARRSQAGRRKAR